MVVDSTMESTWCKALLTFDSSRTLGKLGYYHYTTPAKDAILCATALGFNHSVPRGVAQGNRMKAQTKPNK